jgi:hypothetical protein
VVPLRAGGPASGPVGTGSVGTGVRTTSEPTGPLAAGSGGAPGANACATPASAEVTSLGITQNVLPSPRASSGSVCRYW